ncbi:MAG: hypothetical protein LPK46_02580 [Bacteroidota bacterium]|nr:hypothetical protein [Bacteroidota bacterium]MDX5505005.1 hypothetical protein [Bacteroidota bacterium]
MRIATTIPHPKMRIVVYSLDQFYYIEFEGGPMKQGYKIRKEEVSGLDDLVKKVNDEVSEKVVEEFNSMVTIIKTLKGK